MKIRYSAPNQIDFIESYLIEIERNENEKTSLKDLYTKITLNLALTGQKAGKSSEQCGQVNGCYLGR